MNGQDVLFCCGFLALVCGVALVSVPASLMVGGGLVVVLCVAERLRG